MLSIIVPTYNEKENLPVLVESVFAILNEHQIPAEMVVVDDNSPDGTGHLAEELGKTYPVKVVHREGKLGLSSAVIAGFVKAQGELLLVMDADGSHDAGIIPQMVKALTEEGAELAVGSRYIPGGGVSNWPLKRQLISKFAVLLGSVFTPVKDVTSGFFAFKREIIEGIKINPIGFKIGLEIFAKGRFKKFKEVPFVFTDRRAGVSKLNSGEIKNYLKQLLSLLKYRLFAPK